MSSRPFVLNGGLHTGMPSIKIVVAAHKPCWTPSDSMYVPVMVGAAGKPSIEGFVRDDTGENISDKNPRYSELTALYWARHNIQADYTGLVHYRRYFAGSGENHIATCADMERLIAKAPIVVPHKRRYYIETIESHYGHTFDASQFDLVKAALKELHPNDLPLFEKHLRMRSAHIFNMLVMRTDLFCAYCDWLFPVVDHIDAHLDYSGLTPFLTRAPGRLAERLLDTWLDSVSEPFTECKVTYLDGVNWFKKGSAFLLAKFTGKKYTESF